MHLHFRADLESFLRNNIFRNRCPHKQKRHYSESDNVESDSSYDYTTEDELCHEIKTDRVHDWRFGFLGSRAKAIVSTIDAGQLQNFA